MHLPQYVFANIVSISVLVLIIGSLQLKFVKDFFSRLPVKLIDIGFFSLLGFFTVLRLNRLNIQDTIISGFLSVITTIAFFFCAIFISIMLVLKRKEMKRHGYNVTPRFILIIIIDIFLYIAMSAAIIMLQTGSWGQF